MKLERTLFYGLLAVVFFTTLLEGYHDYYVISDINGNPEKTESWKLLGNLVSFIWIGVAVGLSALLTPKWRLLLWLPIFAFLWWLIHDLTLGLCLTGDPFYIGQGAFDQTFGRMFQQSGLLYAGFKSLWMGLGIATYLSLSKKP